MTTLSIWKQAQSPIKEKIGSASYETWFSSLQIKEEGEETLVIETPDEFFKDWVVEHYSAIIEENVRAVSSNNIQIKFSVAPGPAKQGEAGQGRPPLGVGVSCFDSSSLKSEDHGGADLKRTIANLNPLFSFENFIVGPSNRFAAAACLAVSESPAKAYNPLFIYGPVGLGKTHLMQAIAQKIKSLHPDSKCSYLSSEQFTNELINAIRHKSTSAFRQKYRNIDVLLIDDIHFIAGKESTQEEFFHTFNALHNNRKQLIISSDRPPKEIAKLEERLSSRFAWGLITDIQPPDFETRVAILRKKIEQETIHVPDDVLSFIAEQVKTNIRELEGALIRVVAYSLLEEEEISLAMTKVVLKDMVKETEKIINADTIQKKVADFFQIPLFELKSKRRSKNIILPRQVAMYLTRQLTTLSLPEIGHVFGGKDHTTVLHSCKKIEKALQKDRVLQNSVEKLTTGIQQ